MLNSIKLYFILINISIKSQLKYKLDFFIQLFIWIFYAFVPIISINMLILKFGNLGNWDSNRLLIGYSIIMISYDISRMVGRGFDNFHNYLENGMLDIFFIRPIGISTQIFGNEFFLRRLSGILSYFAVLIVSICKLGNYFEKTYIFFMAIILIIPNILIFLVLLYISSIFTIIFRKRNFISDILIDKTAFISYLPIDFLNKILKNFFTFLVPMYYCYYIPLNTIFNVSFNFELIKIMLISFCISLFYFYISKIAFTIILRNFYVSKGN